MISYKVVNSHGESVAADSKGNNVAFDCQARGYSVLMYEFLDKS